VTAADPRIRGWVSATVTYLEMTAPPRRAARAQRHGVEIRRAVPPTASFFRYLYQAVGEDWTWTARRLMDDDALLAIIHDPSVEVNVLFVDGQPAGLAELDRRSPPAIELGYFGLIPDFVGKGLGGFFLDWAIDHAWCSRPSRFWVHTCDLDHPNALPVYRKAGFRIYRRDDVREVILNGMTPPRRAGEIIEIETPG
jgi:GNAT superfamily N-acetyltransferase